MTALGPNALSQAQSNSADYRQRHEYERQANVIWGQMSHGSKLNDITAHSTYAPEAIALVQKRLNEAQEARVRAAKEVTL